jgi:hypothetical protein
MNRITKYAVTAIASIVICVPQIARAADTYVLNVWDWTDGNASILSTDGSVIYHAGVWAEKGVKRTEIYLDGQVVQTCNYWPGTGNKDCWKEISGQDKIPGTSMFVNAKILDYKGQEKWTDGKTIEIVQGQTTEPEPEPEPDATTPDATTPVPVLNVWDWTDGNASILSTDGSVIYHAGVWAEKGVKKTEIYVDGEVVQTCKYWPGTGNKDCWKEISGQDKIPGTSMFVNARVIDYKDQEKWTDGKTIEIVQ